MLPKLEASSQLLRRLVAKGRDAKQLWEDARMQFKVKCVVGFYQCLAAIPSVYNVVAPTGLEKYTEWLYVLEFPVELPNLIIPAACYGEYRRRLLIGSCWPIVLLLLAAAARVGWELVHDFWRKKRLALAAPRGTRGAVLAGLHRVLPLTLVVTFVMVPSTSTRIFKTFLCSSIEYDDNAAVAPRRYLQDALELRCDAGNGVGTFSEEYKDTRDVAFVLAYVWPVGVTVLCTLACRDLNRGCWVHII